MWQRSVLVVTGLLITLAFPGTSQAQLGDRVSDETGPGKDQETVDLVELGEMHVEGQRLARN